MTVLEKSGHLPQTHTPWHHIWRYWLCRFWKSRPSLGWWTPHCRIFRSEAIKTNHIVSYTKIISTYNLMKLSVQKSVLPLSFSCLVTCSLTYLRENSCNVQRNKVVGQHTLFIVFLHAHLHCIQGFFMILGELYRAIWAPFPDFGGRHCQGRVILLDLSSVSIWW